MNQEPSEPSAQHIQEERLRLLRQQRQHASRLPDPTRFQRRGMPVPPQAQPTFRALLKHWWQHGPFASPTPRAPRPPEPPPKLPVGAGLERPFEERARAWIAGGQREFPHLLARAQDTMQQARAWLSGRSGRGQRAAPQAEAVPGLIVVAFEPMVTREEAVQRLTALGGKPLRLKPSANQYQVAVPPGQEDALIAQLQQMPGVLRAQRERPPG